MGHVVKTILTKLVFIALLAGGVCFQASAQTSGDEGGRSSVRGPDRACLQCHKEESERMLGMHSKAESPNNNEPVTCSNCHGQTKSDHRDGGKGVMVFGAKSQFPLDQRNGACMSCHEIEPMRKALWAHDVHITRTVCTNCHQLHPSKDPVKGLASKDRIKLCVDCHGKLHQEAKAAKEKLAGQVKP